MSVDIATFILRDRTLMFQKPRNFNDPFELHLGLLDFELSEGVVEVYQKYFNDGKQLSDKLKAALEKAGSSIISDAIRDTLDSYRDNVGVTCFSKTSSNPLMWAHYANSHRGVCVGFQIEGWNRVRDTFSVHYANSVAPIKFFDEKERDLSFWYWMFTKSHVWAYEREVRCINMFSNGVQPLEDIIPVEIYYGVGCSEEDIEALEQLSAAFHMRKRIRMGIDPRTFDLIETPMQT
jgi:hypothetical protein